MATATATAFTEGTKVRRAVASLGPSPNQATDSGVRGTIWFEQPETPAGAPVRVRVAASGLKVGKHGFHIHALGDLTQGCMSAGGHFNPLGVSHGGPEDDEANRHAGDLGNIEVTKEDGTVEQVIVDSMISLDPAARGYIVGRSVIIHADEDDLGRGGFPDSKTTGHAGARLACGVIGIAEAATL